MKDVEGLERALSLVEELMELFEDSSPPGPKFKVGLIPVYDGVMHEIRDGLWERFLEARAEPRTPGIWKIVVRFERL